jgi:hypothetical protein
MSFSMSLHIGVNQVDPATYGAVPVLRSAVKDAEAMELVAKDLEYQDRLILRNNEATVSAVLARLGAMAQQVEPGGVVMVSFAGHGSEVPDDTGDEPSGRDQTWVLYDKMLIDDQLRAMWGRFAPGVRIFFVSDSCHSGSVARNFNAILESLKATKRQFLVGTRDILGADVPTERSLPPEAALKAFEKYESEIVSTQWTCGNRGLDDIPATVISLTACQDDEVAGDGVNNGLFTGALLQVWNNGQFSGNSEQLLQAVAGKIRMYQRPQYTLFGATNPGALAQKPFAIATATREFQGFSTEWNARRPPWEGPGPIIAPDWGSDDRFRGIGHPELTTKLSTSSNEWTFRGSNGAELTTRLEVPAFRCVLELNPAASLILTPELFERVVKKELADSLSAAFQQAHTGLVARGVIPEGFVPRGHGEIGGEATCKSENGKTTCEGKVWGSYRF